MRTIWLASYPKSGNTWMRMLIANLSADGDTPIDINALPERGGIASARGPFEHHTLIGSDLLTPDEIDALRPLVHAEIARAEPEEPDEDPAALVRFCKVHDAYGYTPAGEPLLAGSRGAAAAILIVRDPRDVVPSLANHLGTTIERAIDFLNDPDAGFCIAPGQIQNQFRQRLPGWSGHAASWLDQRDLPIHVLRYEDLRAEPEIELRRALDFAGRGASPGQIRKAVALASFERLQAQEAEQGFGEAPRGPTPRRFFRRGVAGGWRDELDAAQVARIESAHAPMMARLGYPQVGAAGAVTIEEREEP